MNYTCFKRIVFLLVGITMLFLLPGFSQRTSDEYIVKLIYLAQQGKSDSISPLMIFPMQEFKILGEKFYLPPTKKINFSAIKILRKVDFNEAIDNQYVNINAGVVDEIMDNQYFVEARVIGVCGKNIQWKGNVWYLIGKLKNKDRGYFATQIPRFSCQQ